MRLELMTKAQLAELVAGMWDDAEEGLEFDGKPDQILDVGRGVVEIFNTPTGIVTAIEMPDGLVQVLV